VYKDLLADYAGVFAKSHKDLNGILVEIAEHKIDLMKRSIPDRQKLYRLNPKFSLLVNKKLDKLLEAQFFYPILSNEWVSPIVAASIPHGLEGQIKI
jgi:hypothetical protein